jgi:pimeloyl-ACP methyl ester carboxylesterase
MKVVFDSVKGVRTRYYAGGNGPQAVLLVHGVGMSADSWFRTIPALERTFRVCAPDLLDNGFTESGEYRGGAPHPLMLDHLIALVDQIGFDRFSIVGSSLGSGLAILLYLRIPTRIEKLVLVGPGAVVEEPAALAKVYEASAANGGAAIDDPTYESCRARVQRVVFDPASVPDTLVAMQMTMYALPGARAVFDRRMKGLRDPNSLREFDAHGKLEQIKIPSLMIFGREDVRGDYQRTMAAAERLPDVEVAIYEKCGHWPHMEHADRFNHDLIGFLSK